jgi:ABC-type transport system involved in cytochrome c biogenesis permease component
MFGPGRAGFRAEIIFAAFYALHVVLKVVVAWDASRRFAEDRDSGALELLLCTPVAENGIWRGWLVGLKRTYVGPVLALAALEFVVLLAGLDTNGWWSADGFWAGAFAIGLLAFLVDLYTLSWVGIWLSVASRNSTRACLGTLGRVLLLPGTLFLGAMAFAGLAGVRASTGFEPILLAWFSLGLLVDFAAGGHAMLKLNEGFRVTIAHAAAPESKRPQTRARRLAERRAAARVRIAKLQTAWR